MQCLDLHYGAVRVLLAVQALAGITDGRPDAAGKSAKQSRSHGLLQDIRNILDSLDDVHSHTPGTQEHDGLAHYNSLLSVSMPPHVHRAYICGVLER